MNAGTVQLNADLLGEILRRDGHALKDFEDSPPLHTNKSTVAKGTWERAVNGDKIRRSSWLEIAEYLRVKPPDLLLFEAGATYDMIVAARSSALHSQQKTDGIIVKRGALTIVIGEEFSDYTYDKQQRVWKLVYDLLGEVGRGPETSGSVLTNLILEGDQVQQAVALFLDGHLRSINATDIILEGTGGQSNLPSIHYSTKPFTSIRSFVAHFLWRLRSDADIDEIATNAMESVFFRLAQAALPVASVLMMCKHYIQSDRTGPFPFTMRRWNNVIPTPADTLDQLVDAHTPTPFQTLLRKELRDRFAEALMRPQPPLPITALKMRLEGATFSKIAQELGLSVTSVKRHFKEVQMRFQEEFADYFDYLK